MGLLDKIFGSKNQKVLKKIQPLVNSINSLEDEYSLLSDTDLKNKRQELMNHATIRSKELWEQKEKN